MAKNKSDVNAKVITNCDHLSSLKFSPSLPFAFTEEGVAMLSSVLRSPIATSVSIRIMDAFVSMRRFFTANAGIFQRLEAVEMKQLQTDKKIDAVMDRLDDGSLKPKLGIFFDGRDSATLSQMFANGCNSVLREGAVQDFSTREGVF